MGLAHHHGRVGRALAGIAGAAVLGCLVGCQEPLGGARGYSLGRVGAPSSAVMRTEFLENSLAAVDESQLPEYGRRDALLSPSSPSPMLASQEWPQPEQPSLENPTYIYVNSNANTQMFFRPDSARYGTPGYAPAAGFGRTYWYWYGW